MKWTLTTMFNLLLLPASFLLFELGASVYVAALWLYGVRKKIIYGLSIAFAVLLCFGSTCDKTAPGGVKYIGTANFGVSIALDDTGCDVEVNVAFKDHQDTVIREPGITLGAVIVSHVCPHACPPPCSCDTWEEHGRVEVSQSGRDGGASVTLIWDDWVGYGGTIVDIKIIVPHSRADVHMICKIEDHGDNLIHTSLTSWVRLFSNGAPLTGEVIINDEGQADELTLHFQREYEGSGSWPPSGGSVDVELSLWHTTIDTDDPNFDSFGPVDKYFLAPMLWADDIDPDYDPNDCNDPNYIYTPYVYGNIDPNYPMPLADAKHLENFNPYYLIASFANEPNVIVSPDAVGLYMLRSMVPLDNDPNNGEVLLEIPIKFKVITQDMDTIHAISQPIVPMFWSSFDNRYNVLNHNDIIAISLRTWGWLSVAPRELDAVERLSEVADCWLSSVEYGNYRADLDINLDGFVNLMDIKN